MRNWIRTAGVMLAIPAVLWLGGQAFGFGRSFDKPALPQGAHLMGPAGKGTVIYTINNGNVATISFEGRCGNMPVSTSPIDVTQLTDATVFATATEKAVADSLEGWFLDISSVTAFQGCYNNSAIGIYITAINKSVTKTSTMWVGEATIQGVR